MIWNLALEASPECDPTDCFETGTIGSVWSGLSDWDS